VPFSRSNDLQRVLTIISLIEGLFFCVSSCSLSRCIVLMSSAMNHSSMSDSVDWEDLMDISGSISNQDRHAADPPLPHPTLAQLKQRWAFRKTIQAESTLHRRIHAHAPSGRNILLTLRQRELRGCKHTVLANTGYSSKRKRSEERDGDDHGTIRSRSAYPTSLLSEIQYFAEYSSVTSFQTAFFHHLGGEDVPNANGERPSSSKAVSTISVAFSPDSRTMASTHGDHTVKITCSSSGILLQSLEGHPRTPWTVKYHPLRPEILASGCLGFQVRVWNWEQGQCLQMIRLDYAIISLSFHPTGNILAVASGSRLHFWDYDNFGGRLDNQGRKATTGVLTELEQHHMLRCVHFPPDGKTVIVGGINENDGLTLHARNRGGMTGGGISFYLRLWDFKMDVALHPDTRPPNVARGRRSPIDNVSTYVNCVLSLIFSHPFAHSLPTRASC
jgi:WD40 repeat protein